MMVVTVVSGVMLIGGAEADLEVAAEKFAAGMLLLAAAAFIVDTPAMEESLSRK